MSFKSFINEVNKNDTNNVFNLEEQTNKNDNFRKVIFTSENLQLVLMSLKPNEEIGEESHDVDQFFRIDSGSGKVIIDDKEYNISDGYAFIVPANVKHNVIADENGLKLYTIYAPPHHEDKLVQKNKEI